MHDLLRPRSTMIASTGPTLAKYLLKPYDSAVPTSGAPPAGQNRTEGAGAAERRSRELLGSM